ncbi:uncharacterized protein NPIL_628401 [Nephila pilipes]|uniref:Uncharacterized protein n=1 Tax=Nephila pilipes TaxID=299642 RepID=A0A8X6QMZ0_NEPPI|nr:uncharacterized protein NPIL_628401 [Nephila pilipes]
MQQLLAYQSERKLKQSEKLVDYTYAKDYLLENASFTIPRPDRISMVIGDITEVKRQIALATQNSITIEELIDTDTPIIKEYDSSEEESESAAEILDPADDF